jgi:hypothetical protein
VQAGGSLRATRPDPAAGPSKLGLQKEQRAGIAAEPQEETLMKGAQKPKKGDKKPAQKTLKEKRQDKRNAAKGNSSIT